MRGGSSCGPFVAVARRLAFDVLVFEQRGRLFVVRYSSPEDLLPARQGELVARLSGACAQGAAGIVFVLSPGISWVDSSVPKFWLEVTAQLKLSAMAIVTASPGVRVAASGFRLANIVRGVKLQVATFEDEAAATRWAEPLCREAPA